MSASAKPSGELKDAQSDLQPGRKQEVEKATQQFTKQVGSTLSGVTSGLSLSNAEAQVKSAASQLAASYKQIVAPTSCS